MAVARQKSDSVTFRKAKLTQSINKFIQPQTQLTISDSTPVKSGRYSVRKHLRIVPDDLIKSIYGLY